MDAWDGELGEPGAPGSAAGPGGGGWNAVVDVSNVCWSPQLPPVGRRRPAWERLALVTGAWRAAHGAGARLHLVADESLMRALDDAGQLRQLAARGEVTMTQVADSVILPMARDRGLHVITRDHYVDHRIEHPWIDRSPWRFHGWDTVDGEVRLAPLGITPVSAQEVSLAREIKDLKRTRLDPKSQVHRRILHTRWKCGNTSCSMAATWQEQLLVWPLVSPSGEAICPSCDQPLISLGPRAPLHEVVVAVREPSQPEIMRFPLETDVPVIVGRGHGIKGVDLTMDPLSDKRAEVYRDAVLRVSRLHLLVRIEEVSAVNWRLAAIDLDSTNGTEVERWNGTGFLPSRPVTSEKETFLSARDRLVLGGAIQLRLSGRRYLVEPGAPPPLAAATDDGAPGEIMTAQTMTIPRRPADPRQVPS
jgi:hypothetical protein